jgi:hypothetical protein
LLHVGRKPTEILPLVGMRLSKSTIESPEDRDEQAVEEACRRYGGTKHDDVAVRDEPINASLGWKPEGERQQEIEEE